MDFLMVLLVCFLIPWVVYFSVKFGTFAYLRGRHLAERHKDGE